MSIPLTSELKKEGRLSALRDALAADDARLVQGLTVLPPPFPSTAGQPCEAACLVAYAGWRGGDCRTVGDASDFFRGVCRRAADRLGDRGEVRWLLKFWDTTPRDKAVAALLPEVERALAELERPA